MARRAISELHTRTVDVLDLILMLHKMAGTVRSLLKHSDLPYSSLEKAEETVWALDRAEGAVRDALDSLEELLRPNDAI